MRRRLRTVGTVLAAVVLGAFAADGALAEAGPKDKFSQVKLLAFNDFHGHLEATTPGRLNLPTTGVSVPAGGAEFFATHLKALGSESPDTYVVSAGDLIGASPLLSGLFHDEPTIDFMNYVGLDVNGVGNHEFDEGKAELLRMQNGNQLGGNGCHPIDGCQDGTPYAGSVFQFLAANVIDTDTSNPLLPEYELVTTSAGEKIAFIGETLQGTPLIVTPTGVAGLEFLDEADTVNRLVPRLRAQGVQAMVLLLHQGGAQSAPFSRGFVDVNACENLVGPDLLDVVSRLDREVDLVVSAHTHQPYICPNLHGHFVTSASSFGRAITEIELTIKREAGEVEAVTAVNHVVTQDVASDAGATAILAHYKTFADPIGNRVIGSITADILSGRDAGGSNAAGEQPMGDVIADAQLEATSPTDFGGSKIAFMNPGGVRAGLFFNQLSGGEAPGEVTYAEAFTVQPFGNSLVVKTCTGEQIYDLLEQQFDNPAAGQRRILLVSAGFTYQYRVSTTPHVVDGSALLDGAPLDRSASHRVTMNSFLADGGDGFSVFKECTDPLGGEVDLDAFVRYFQNHSPVAPPPLNRIVRLD